MQDPGAIRRHKVRALIQSICLAGIYLLKYDVVQLIHYMYLIQCRYCGDAVRKFGTQFDKCGGFSARDVVYKYHVAPVCLQQQQQQSSYSVADHSPQLGWALDGFPIYGDIGAKVILCANHYMFDANASLNIDTSFLFSLLNACIAAVSLLLHWQYEMQGVVMARCGTAGAHPVLCLDACNGYYGRLPGYDKFMYRYYIPGNHAATGECAAFVQNGGTCERETEPCCVSSLPRPVHYPYTIGCLRGCPVGDTTCTLSSTPGVTDDYIPSLSNFPKQVYAQDEAAADSSEAIDSSRTWSNGTAMDSSSTIAGTRCHIHSICR